MKYPAELNTKSSDNYLLSNFPESENFPFQILQYGRPTYILWISLAKFTLMYTIFVQQTF